MTLFGRRGLSARERVGVTRQLATMIEAGLPIVQALDVLEVQAGRAGARQVLGALRDDVESGASLSEALRRHPASFDRLHCSLVAAGEVAGALDTVLEQLAEHAQSTLRLRRRLQGALLYPATVLLVSVAATAVLLVYVVPVFASLFDSLGGDLPAPTRVVVAVSRATVAHAHHALALAAAGGVAMLRLARVPVVQRACERLARHVPLAGRLRRDAAAARVARTLGMLLEAGVPLLEGLDVAADTAGSPGAADAVRSAGNAVARGEGLADALSRDGALPAAACRMIAVGETTGKLDSMLRRVAEALEQEVDQTVGDLTTLLEPLVVLFLGALVGGLVVSMYLPIFRLGALMG